MDEQKNNVIEEQTINKMEEYKEESSLPRTGTSLFFYLLIFDVFIRFHDI